MLRERLNYEKHYLTFLVLARLSEAAYVQRIAARNTFPPTLMESKHLNVMKKIQYKGI